MGLFGAPAYWAAFSKAHEPGSRYKQGHVICNYLEAANCAPGQLNGCNDRFPRPCQPCSPVMWFNGNREPARNGSVVLARRDSRNGADRQTGFQPRLKICQLQTGLSGWFLSWNCSHGSPGTSVSSPMEGL